MKLTWHIENLFFTCTWFSFRPQTFNSYNQVVLVKLRRIAVLVVILFRRHTSAKFQEAISWSRTWTFFVHCLSLKDAVSDHFRWGNGPCQLIKINWERVFILIKFAHGTDVWNFLSSACTSMWGIWILSDLWNASYIELRIWNQVSHDHRSYERMNVFEYCSIRLSIDWNHLYETTDHLQQFRADKFSTFFKSEAFPFSSAS